MLTVDWFKGKHVTVMGLGVHGGGLGSAKWLMRHGAKVTVTDLRDQHSLADSIAALERAWIIEAHRADKGTMHRVRYVLGRHDESDFSGADMVIRNPAVPREHPLLALAAKRGVPVESDVSLFFLLCPFPIAAISGTKGKTTTTTLLAAMGKAHDKRTVVGGNIRISPLDALDGLLRLARSRRVARNVPSRIEGPPIVLELSSWQLESLERHRLSPRVGVLTNVLEDHLNRYEGMDDYARAKELILAFQKEGDVAVVNVDNPRVAAMGRRKSAVRGATHGGKRSWFSLKKQSGLDGCFVEGRDIVLRDGGKKTKVMPVSAIKLQGVHNRANALAAIAAAHAMGIPLEAIRRGIADTVSVPGRLEDVRVWRGIRFVNDTTATAPDASVAALETLGKRRKRIVLIAGGADKELTFDAWAAKVPAAVRHLVLFDGSATPKMETALANAGANVPIAGARSMREALGEAVRHAKKGDIVLLSPGCASFGIFKNEFDRGDQFVALVKKLR
jgi:UDP-N-acetylmuramoylalanine--D-glutamate ligase